MKEQIIQIPDTLEVKEIKDGKIILVEKEKKLTYEDITRELFSKCYNYIDSNGKIHTEPMDDYHIMESNNCTSKKQAEKLLAINKLMNVAKYLNGDWQPDWDYIHEKKYYIYVENEQIDIRYVDTVQFCSVYFKSEELAEKAIDILGEETIRLALSTDY